MFWERFADLVLRGRALWLALGALASLLSLAQLPRLVYDGSLERIMLLDDPDRAFNAAAQERFGGDEVVMVVLEGGDAYAADTLARVGRLSASLAEIPGVAAAYSLTAAPVLERGADGTLDARTVGERLEGGWTPADVARYAAGNDLVVPDLVSEDGRFAAITLRLGDLEGIPVEAKQALVADVRRVVEAEVGDEGYRLAGWPVVQAAMTDAMLSDTLLLVPLSGLVIAAALYLCFRRLAGVVLPLVSVGAGSLWTVGLLVGTGRSISMITNSLPMILMAICAAASVHYLGHLFSGLAEHGDQKKAARDSLVVNGPAVLFSALTTALGFAAVTFTRVEAIYEFGVFAAVGTAFGFFATAVFMPSLSLAFRLRPMPGRAGLHERFKPADGLEGTLKRRRLVLALTAATIALTAVGLGKMRVETAPASFFPEDAPVRQDIAVINDRMVGITPYNVVITSPDEGGILAPGALAAIADLQTWLEAQPEVDSTLAVTDTLRTLSGALQGEAALPDDSDLAEQLLVVGESMDAGLQESLLSSDRRQANVIVRTTILSSEQGVEFARRLDAELARRLPAGLEGKTTGSAFLAYKTNIEFNSGLMTSLLLSSVLMLGLMVFLFRSLRLGLIAMVPNLLPILTNYALIGLFGLTLNAGTSITGSIAMGIAVDDTIHFLLAFRAAHRAGHSRKESVRHALAEVGPSMWTTSLCLSAGFAVLLFSSFLPVSSLGLLVSITMLTCALADIYLMPVLLTSRLAGEDAAAKGEALAAK